MLCRARKDGIYRRDMLEEKVKQFVHRGGRWNWTHNSRSNSREEQAAMRSLHQSLEAMAMFGPRLSLWSVLPPKAIWMSVGLSYCLKLC